MSNVSAIVETWFTTINRNVGKYDSVINTQWYNGQGWRKWVLVQFNNAIPYYELMKGDHIVSGAWHCPNRRQQFTFFPLPIEHVHMYTSHNQRMFLFYNFYARDSLRMGKIANKLYRKTFYIDSQLNANIFRNLQSAGSIKDGI